MKRTILSSLLLSQLCFTSPLHSQQNLASQNNATPTPQAGSVVEAWFPLKIGDKWTYAFESRDGTYGGIAHPTITRFRYVDTIQSVTITPDGTLVELATEWLQPAPKAGHTAISHLLARGSCVYYLDGAAAFGNRHALDRGGHLTPEFRKELLADKVPPQFCFPLRVSKVWGTKANFEWSVRGETRAANGRGIFHVYTFLGAGTTVDIWFQKGRGVVRERELHNGTYWEDRTTLLRTELRADGAQ